MELPAGAVNSTIATISALLNRVIVNRNKRKAKNIVATGLEFTLAVATLMISADTKAKEVAKEYNYEDGLATEAIALGIISILYVITLSTVAMIHASRLPCNCNTSAEIEVAFAKTNNMPIIDGILEIPLASRFGGKWFVAVVYSIFVLTLVALFYVLKITYWDTSTLTSILLAIFTMYRFTADICEYRVFTLPKNLNLEVEAESSVP